MSDPAESARPGAASPFLNDRATIDGTLDAVRSVRAQRFAGGALETGNKPPPTACHVFVRNDTGATLDPFAVLALGDPLPDVTALPHEMRRSPLFAGDAPAATTDVFAVTVEPIPDDAIGRAIVAGIAVVKIDVTDAAHTHAVPDPTQTDHLDSATSGPARIIWKETGTGTGKWAVVLLGGGAGAAADVTRPTVRAATTGNVTLSTGFENGDTLDGVVLATGDRILNKDATTGAERGIYVVAASGAPTRAADADAVNDVVGMLVTVQEGTSNADTIWLCTTNATWTPGVTSSSWAKVYPQTGVSPGWFARLTTSSGGAWKWVKVVQSAGSWVDSGSESSSFNAYPSKIDPTLTCNPHAGQRVWMIDSSDPGKYEFAAVLSPPLLCEVTTAGTSATVKQKTYSGSVADVSGPVSYTSCRNAGPTAAPGEKVLMWKIPDVDGEHWIAPVAPAYGSGSGYDTYSVSSTTTYTNVLVTAAATTPLVLPGHGTYRMHVTCKMRFSMPDPSYQGSANIGTFRLRWRNDTDGTNYTDYFAASSQLTSYVLDPGGAPNDTVWEFCVAMSDDLTVSAGTNVAKNFRLQADFVQGGGGGTGVISELRVGFLKIA